MFPYNRGVCSVRVPLHSVISQTVKRRGSWLVPSWAACRSCSTSLSCAFAVESVAACSSGLPRRIAARPPTPLSAAYDATHTL